MALSAPATMPVVSHRHESVMSLSPATKKVALELSTSGLAVCTATVVTNPIDVVKVRVQLAQGSLTAAPVGLVGTATSLVRNEGELPDTE
jgi:Mitochondrial carrier protein